MSKVVFWIVVAPLAAAVIVFSVNNREDVVLDLWPLDLMTAPWPLNLMTEPLPVFSVMLAGIVAGFLAGGLVAWISAGKSRKRARLEAERAKRAENELTEAKDHIRRLERETDELRSEAPKLPDAAA